MPNNPSTTDTLIAPRFLFRFALPLRRNELVGTTPTIPLDDSHRLLSLSDLDQGTSHVGPEFAEVRMAWSSAGLAFQVTVQGKTQLPWCRESRLEDSDGFQVWIDTRATHNIHRASKFCHRFMFLPSGGGHRADQPVADQLLINRARENARPVRPRELQVAAAATNKGYELRSYVPAIAMTGFDPAEHPKLGFTYAVMDRELGVQTFASGIEFPYQEDPSCWATLELPNE